MGLRKDRTYYVTMLLCTNVTIYVRVRACDGVFPLLNHIDQLNLLNRDFCNKVSYHFPGYIVVGIWV